jgi:hypothetical protein
MKALVAVAGLVLSLGWLPTPVTAGELRGPLAVPNPFAMTPPPVPLGARPVAPVQPLHRHPGPPPVVYPCCAGGYWAYQWVPVAYTTYIWVPGYVTEDGTMVGGGYQPQVVPGGYYQRVWVTGY